MVSLYKRFFFLIVFSLFSFALYAMGNKEAPTFVHVDDGGYISPNGDGLFDYIDFSFISSIKLKSLSGYLPNLLVQIVDEDESIIQTLHYSEEPDLKRSKQLITPYRSFLIARHFHFNATDEFGNPFPDKTYKIKLTITDANENSTSTIIKNIIVDTTKPFHQFLNRNSNFKEDSSTIFLSTANKQSEQKIIINQTGSQEKLWTARIVDANQLPIKTLTYHNSSPLPFEWDGSDSNNAIAPEGRYTYEIFSTDEAGNKTYQKLEPIYISHKHTPIELELSSASLVIDSQKDKIYISPICKNPEEIIKWKYSLTNQQTNTPVVELYSTSSMVKTICLDSYAHINGKIVETGFYLFNLTLWYKNGDNPTIDKLLYFDTTKAIAEIKSSPYQIISPKTKNGNNYFEFIQDGTVEEIWQMDFINSDNEVVYSKQSKKGKPHSFKWYGTDNNNKPLPDGAYSYRLTAFNPVNDLVFEKTISDFILLTYDVGIETNLSHKLFSAKSPLNEVEPTITLSYKEPQHIVGIDYSFSAIPSNSIVSQTYLEVPAQNLNEDSKEETAEAKKIQDWLPTQIIIPKVNQKDEPLPDGRYKFKIQVRYNNGATLSNDEIINIDSTPPKLSFKGATAPIRQSQKSDPQSRTFSTFIAEDNSSIEKWELTIYNAQKKEIKKVIGNNNPSKSIYFSSSQQNNGYSLSLEVFDKAGNVSKLSTPSATAELVFIDQKREILLGLPSIPFGAHRSNLNSVIQSQYNESLQTLARLKKILDQYPNYNLLIKSHALNSNLIGSIAYNQEEEALLELTQKRAQAIKNYLCQTLLVSENRVITKGLGSAEGLYENQDFSKNYKNNRVDFILIPTGRY